MKKQLKSIPQFTAESDEREFWENAQGRDSTDYVDWNKAQRAIFPDIKPTSQTISLRLPLSLLQRIKIAANKQDIPYQSLIKIWLSEKVT